MDRDKEKGDPEQIVAAFRACLFDGRVQVLTRTRLGARQY
jgi:hypothetical protein